MAFYYVKDDGTATGDGGRYASQQTGTFAALGVSGYYASIADAIAATTSPAAGDFINVSDLHLFSSGSNINYLGVSGSKFFIVAVSDINIDAGRRSGNYAKEEVTGSTLDIDVDSVFISGVELSTGDNFTFSRECYFIDSIIESRNGGNTFFTGTDGSHLKLINSELAIQEISTDILLIGGGTFEMDGGAVTTTSAGLTALFNAGATAGGMNIYFNGVDLSAITGTLIAGTGSNPTSTDSIDVKFDMCKLSAGVSFTNETFVAQDRRALFTRCSDSSTAAEYQYHLHAFGGDINDDTSIFRNEDVPFTESNQKISYEIVTNSDASLGSPLWFDFPMLRYSRLSASATDTLRFYITSNTALTDKDIYIELSYPDSANKQTPNFISSAPNTAGGSLDLMDAGTTLTTDATSSWTGALSNLYQIDVSTVGDPGADCQPIVKVYVTIPSVTIHIASEYGLN